MRFLHTADLHLGKLMNDLPLLSDQEAILQQIAQIACDEKADAVLIAGDVYQRTAPQAEAMALFDSFVSHLVQAGKKVFVISGNHDSAPRISYFSALVKNAGGGKIHFSPSPAGFPPAEAESSPEGFF